MTSSSKRITVPPPVMVEVVVVVNHDDLRRGERGEVELTDHLRARLDKGYLKLAEDAYLPEGAPAPAALGATAARGNSLLGVMTGVGVSDDPRWQVPPPV